MSEWLRKNAMLCTIILIVVIIILAILRIMGGSTWAEWWGLQLIWAWGWFSGQRPFSYEHAGYLISFGAMIALIVIVIIVIYLLRGTFKAKGK